MAHSFRFFRAGGFDQLRLEEAEEILALAELDQKLWAALSCPTSGLELDPRTLQLVDTDRDGRIRPPEVLAAVEFVGRTLAKPEAVRKRTAKVALSAIDEEDDEGKRLLASAKQILKNLGKKSSKEITLEDVLDTAKIFAQTKLNGDGVVPADSAEDPAVAKAIEDTMSAVGSVTDRSGKPGISKEKLEEFFAQAAALDAWWTKGESAPEVNPLGAATAPAADAVHAVRAKVEDYFMRCRLAAFDPKASGPLNRAEQDYASLASRDLTADDAAIAAFPLARVEASRALPLEAGVNPAWAATVRALATDAVRPLVGARPALSEADWSAITAKLEPHLAWRATKPATSLDTLEQARVRELLRGSARAEIEALIAKDLALAPEAEAIEQVERLLRYHRDLHVLLCNFVSFRDFYAREGAIFQAGTLYLDGRSCDLCVRIDDAAAHAAVGALANTFLVYCDCARIDADGTKQTMTIVAALTAGSTGQVRNGRHGIFYDRRGRDWDATVVKVVEHPISIRQAFWLPYIRIGRFVGEQIEKFATARDTEVHDVATGHVKVVADDASEAASLKTAAPSPGPAPTPAPETAAPRAGFDVAKFAGIFAAIGLAVGAIGSSLVAVGTGFISLRWWQMPLAVVGVMLVISGPSMLIASMKLHRRNLGPILDGAGWAVNAQAKLNIPFGASLTSVAVLPPGAARSTQDPYAEKRHGWMVWLLVIFVLGCGVAWELGWFKPWVARISPRPPASAAPAPAPSSK